MKKSLTFVLFMLVTISVVFSACNGSNLFESTTTTSTTNTTTTTPTTTTTTTRPTTTTTTQPSIDRDDVLPGEPSKLDFTMNSAGGIDIWWEHKYTGDKDLKYYTVTFHMYNSVDDEVYDEITGKATRDVRVSGPVEPGSNLLVIADAVMYSHGCTKVQIDEIKFDYMDGTSAEFWYGWYSGVNY